MRNFRFTQFPTQEHDLSFDFAGKIQQTNIDVFYLNPGSMNLGHRVFCPLDSTLALRLAPRHFHDVDQRAPIQKNPVCQSFRLSIDFFNQLLAIDGGTQ